MSLKHAFEEDVLFLIKMILDVQLKEGVDRNEYMYLVRVLGDKYARALSYHAPRRLLVDI